MTSTGARAFPFQNDFEVPAIDVRVPGGLPDYPVGSK